MRNGDDEGADVPRRTVYTLGNDEFLREQSYCVGHDNEETERSDTIDGDTVRERGGDFPLCPRSGDCRLDQQQVGDEERTDEANRIITAEQLAIRPKQVGERFRNCSRMHYRSTSPRTMSRLPREAIMSGMYSPLDISPSVWRFEKHGLRILKRAGLSVPSERM